MAEPVTVVGGTITALVAVERLAAAGTPVRWLRPRSVGGGFRPRVVDGRVLSLGARLLELGYGTAEDTKAAPLSAYRPGHVSHRPFTQLVVDHLLELLRDDLVDHEPPSVRLGGRTATDWFYTSDLTHLRPFLDDDLRRRVLAELDAVEAELGPRGLLAAGDDDLAPLGLRTASVRNHGATFHRHFVEPGARKLLGDALDTVPADLRQKIWLPLYWPATVREAMGDGPVSFRPPRRYTTDRHYGMGAVVDRTEERIDAAPGVEQVVVGPLRKLLPDGEGGTLCFDDREVAAGTVVLATGPEELFAAVGAEYAPPRLASHLVWVEAPRAAVDDFGAALVVLDEDSALHRISWSTAASPDHVVLCLELAHGASGEWTGERATTELVAVGVLEPGAGVVPVDEVRVPTAVVPTAEARAAFAAARAVAADALGAVRVAGPCTAFGADALNEQVFHGIRIAKELA